MKTPLLPTAVVVAATTLASIALFGQAGNPESQLRIECSCPVTVRGANSGAVTYTLLGDGRAPRTYVKGGYRWFVAEGDSAEFKVSVPASFRVIAVKSRGNIDARGLAGSLDAETVGGRLLADGIDGDASVRAVGGEIKIGSVKGSLRALSGGNGISVTRVDGEIWCETAGGEIMIERAGGAIHASTGGGNVYVRDAGSSVTLRSDGGLIDVQKAAGFVDAGTRGGSIQVGASQGVQCESAIGAIRLRNISGSVRAQTAIGNIWADLFAPMRGESSLVTAQGDVFVTIPSNLAVTLEAVSESRGRLARIVSDFPEFRIQAGSAQAPSVRASGALNGGGPALKVYASSGTIYLRRQR